MAQAEQAAWFPRSTSERAMLIRRRAGVKQSEIAERMAELGVTVNPSMLSLWENGRREGPNLIQAIAWAGALGVSPIDLGITREDYPGMALLEATGWDPAKVPALPGQSPNRWLGISRAYLGLPARIVNLDEQRARRRERVP
jgi:transcriptional regulator with XRE-family HTH domain